MGTEPNSWTLICTLVEVNLSTAGPGRICDTGSRKTQQNRYSGSAACTAECMRRGCPPWQPVPPVLAALCVCCPRKQGAEVRTGASLKHSVIIFSTNRKTLLRRLIDSSSGFSAAIRLSDCRSRASMALKLLSLTLMGAAFARGRLRLVLQSLRKTSPFRIRSAKPSTSSCIRHQ